MDRGGQALALLVRQWWERGWVSGEREGVNGRWEGGERRKVVGLPQVLK
jgi:hypothetical protein